MKRICLALLLLLSLEVPAQRYRPTDFTFSYLFDQSGQTDREEMEDSVRQIVSTYSFRTPDVYVNALSGLVALAESKPREKTTLWRLDQLKYDANVRQMRRSWPAFSKYFESLPAGDLSTRAQAERCRMARLMERIAGFIDKNPPAYHRQASAAATLLDTQLWDDSLGHWGEFRDTEGLQRLHTFAAVPSLYAPVVAGACSPEQAYRATRYLDSRTLRDGELLPTAMANFLAGRNGRGYQLLKAGLMSQVYGGQSPIDSVRQAVRVLTEGLFGIQPDALNGRCIIRPGFPDNWDTASVHTPYVDYTCRRVGNYLLLDVTQHFRRTLQIVVRLNLGMGQYKDVEFSRQRHQLIRVKQPIKLPEVTRYEAYESVLRDVPGLDEPTFERTFKMQRIGDLLRDSVAYHMNPDFVLKREYVVRGVPFLVPQQGPNVALVAYPDTLVVPVSGKAERAWLLLTGTTNDREQYISNALVVARYQDGTTDRLSLVNPDNWGPLPVGEARRLCLRLNPDKKLAAIEILPLAHTIRIGLMGLTLQ